MSEKTTIGLTEDNLSYIKDVAEFKKFKNDIDIGRLAFAYALKNNYDEEIHSFNESVTTHWSVAIDSNDEMTSIVQSLFPECDSPYRFIQSAINVGLNHLKKEYPNGDLDLRLIMKN